MDRLFPLILQGHRQGPPPVLRAFRYRLVALSLGFTLIGSVCVHAQSPRLSGNSFIARYQARVSATQAEQPHWVTPLVTVTPRLEQEIRSDFVRQTNSS